ncbi:hypothetical protein [Mesorhizobium sp. ES1-3]|uniref:hypothetical protein n=1 Tax=Mesorhizobium sp. ES1-3 TaxID=2876628 RepID=UPI001CC9D90D|nr:hypothetical protein [Mesorhizobium sp. ES1-3]MBZ9674033.1 hypothetical protein [Mesorhizobium sp. ES1-3]
MSMKYIRRLLRKFRLPIAVAAATLAFSVFPDEAKTHATRGHRTRGEQNKACDPTGGTVWGYQCEE